MFIFDIRDDDDVSLDGVCGSSLKKVLNNICGDLRKTSCLQIQEPHASGIPSYYHYCLRYLSYGVQSSGKAKRII